VLYYWQYQAKAEPVLKPEDFAVGLSLWFVQASEPVWIVESPVAEGRGNSCELLESSVFTVVNLDWLVQHPEPRVDSVVVAEGFAVFGNADVPIVLYDWIVQHPQPLPIPQLVAEGDRTAIVEPTLFTSQNLDWNVQSHNPPRGPEPLVYEGLWSGVLDETLYTAVAIDWCVQCPEPQPYLRGVDQGESVSITEPTVHFVSVPFDWIVQHPVPPVDHRPLVAEGDQRNIVEPTSFVVPPFDWYVLLPGPFPGLALFDYGLVVSPLIAIIPTAGSYADYGVPFLYTSANWAGVVFVFEVYMRASTGVVRTRLYDKTVSAAVSDSEMSTTSTAFVRLRSPVLSFTDAHEYVLQLALGSGGLGEAIGGCVIAYEA